MITQEFLKVIIRFHILPVYIPEGAYISSVEGHKFIEEALRMRDFQHQNVLGLIGVSLDRDAGDMPLVVLPFMKHGDLLSYLRNEQSVSVQFIPSSDYFLIKEKTVCR